MTQDSQLPPVRVDSDLEESVQEFKQQNPSITSDSEAIRELLRRGLQQDEMAFGLMLMLSAQQNDMEAMSDALTDAPQVANVIVNAVNDLLTHMANSTDLDLFDLVGGEEEVSKEEMAAIYRVQRGEANLIHLLTISDLLEDLGQSEQFGNAALSYMDNMEDPDLEDLLGID